MKKITKFACMLLVMGGGLIGLSSCGGDDVPPVVQNPAAPTGLTYESVTDVSAVLTWAGESTTYEVVVGSAAAVVVTGNSYTASGLTPETQYTWKVRAKDGDLYSDWVNGNPFTTESGGDTHTFIAGDFLQYGAAGSGYNWYVRLNDEGVVNTGTGQRLTLDLYGVGGSTSVIADGTYTPGSPGNWKIDVEYSAIVGFVSGTQVSFDPLASGTATTTNTGGNNYTIVIDLVTEAGVIIKTTFSGPMTSQPGQAPPTAPEQSPFYSKARAF